VSPLRSGKGGGVTAVRDLTGQRFWRLTVMRQAVERKRTSWDCLCDCGAIVTVRADALTSGGTKSCGCQAEDSGLLTSTGKRCCLGFLGCALGLDDEQMVRYTTDEDFGDTVPRRVTLDYPSYVKTLADWPGALFVTSPHARHPRADVAPWQEIIGDINDTPDMDDATRESWVTAAFREVLGIEVEFFGKYPTPDATETKREGLVRL
jgi:hypothetical protein